MDLNEAITRARGIKNVLRQFEYAEEILQQAASAQGNVNDLVAARKTLQDDIDSLRRAREASEKELASFDRERTEAVERLAEVKADLRQATMDVDREKARLQADLATDQERAKSQMDGYVASLQKSADEVSVRLNAEITALVAKRDALKDEIAAIRSKLEG